ncbi:hypothetical protein SAMN04488691_101557 [Haloferax larsenii]|uniref:Uncharacterized protein n=1 Tax=Haloferax larsenii TaxID=302484 RepID=A0A1H7HDK2_HALLR|nr:hypothetical protein SAMN04488691_101557 [Haloferax larsenii]
MSLIKNTIPNPAHKNGFGFHATELFLIFLVLRNRPIGIGVTV